MLKVFKKEMVLSLAVALLLSTTAHANDLINNNASGNVGGMFFGSGGINQSATDQSETTAEVGSISAVQAYDNLANGTVGGDIYRTRNTSPKTSCRSAPSALTTPRTTTQKVS